MRQYLGPVPFRLMPRPVAPFKAVPRWTQRIETKLQKTVIAGQARDEQRIAATVDDLSSLSSRTLSDASVSLGRAGRTVGRIDCLEDAEGPGADADDPAATYTEAGDNAAGQPAPDASRYMAAYMAGAAGVAAPGHQEARQGHAHPPSRAQPHSQPASDAAEAQRMAAHDTAPPGVRGCGARHPQPCTHAPYGGHR